MRVLIICDGFPPSSFGGGGITALRLAQGLERRGCNVTVACNEQPAGADADRAVHRIFMGKPVWQSLAAGDMDKARSALALEARRLKRTVDEVDPDVILCLHQWGLAPATVLRIGELDRPRVYRFGDEWVRLHLLQRLAQEPWSRLCATRELAPDAAIANSADLAERVSPLFDIPVRVIRNGVDISKFTPRSRTPLCSRGARLLFVGRMVRHKGPDLALQALSWLRDRGIDASLTLVGSVPVDSRSGIDIRQEAARLDLTRHATIAGQVQHDQLADTYAAHDIVVFSSRPRGLDRTIEGCPNVLIEAIATTTPIAGVPGPSVHEIAIDGRTAALARTPDAAGLGEAIARLLRSPELVGTLRDEMLRWRTSFALDAEVAGIEEVLRSVI